MLPRGHRGIGMFCPPRFFQHLALTPRTGGARAIKSCRFRAASFDVCMERGRRGGTSSQPSQTHQRRYDHAFRIDSTHPPRPDGRRSHGRRHHRGPRFHRCGGVPHGVTLIGRLFDESTMAGSGSRSSASSRWGGTPARILAAHGTRHRASGPGHAGATASRGDPRGHPPRRPVLLGETPDVPVLLQPRC